MAEEYQKALSSTGLSLRSHQLDGIKTMLTWRRSNHGGIVADDMGLGKTCQAIALMSVLETPEHKSRYLVICPLSVIDHWEEELRRFGLGKLYVKRYTGDGERRSALQKEMQKTDWNVLLTTYQYVIRDAAYFTAAWKFTALFFDEAHRLKSSSSVLHEIVRDINSEFILLLTGTPIQNNLKELYSLLTLVDKKRFLLHKVDDFLEKYKDMEDEKVAKELRDLLSAYLLRRTKEEVAIEIPSSTQVILYHGISDVQKKLYRAILCRNHRFFEQIGGSSGDKSSGSKMSLLNVMMQLRKCVCHPYLFEGVEPEPFVEGEHLVEASGKLALLDRLLSFLQERDHRVLIFSQMTRVLDIVQDFLTYRGYSYERLDGSVRAEERFAAISNFQKPMANSFCFLLSTRAGGVGLNLTGADTVIFLDSDFNPQNDLQAAARCHRIGQTKPVKVIRLIARNTVEEVIQYRATRKLRMTRQVLGSSESEKENMTAAEITNMILYGLGQLNADDAEQNEDVLDDDEIEKIIGSSENGKWKVMEAGSPKRESPDVMDVENEPPESTNVIEEQMQDMYIFEGHDYKNDRKSLEEIIAEGQAAEAATSRRASPPSKTEGRPRVSPPPRKPLTKEQIEERTRKRAETLKKKKELEIEQKKKKEKAMEERKANLWKKNNYVSLNLPLLVTTSDDEEEEEEVDLDGEIGDRYGPFFVVGDVTKPKTKRGDETKHAVIVHVVDDSGKFGRGGVFNALRSKSSRVEECYGLADRMDDLHIGDAVFVEGIAETGIVPATMPSGGESDESEGELPGDEFPSSTSGEVMKKKESVVLLVAQHARQRDQIDQEALAKSLSRLSVYANQNKDVSVHLPRIGYGIKNIQWYIIERLIRKYLASKRIVTYIYYYRRGRATTAEDERSSETKNHKRPPGTSLGTSMKSTDTAETSRKSNEPAVASKKSNESPGTSQRTRRKIATRPKADEDEYEEDIDFDVDESEEEQEEEEEEEAEMTEESSSEDEEEDIPYDESSSDELNFEHRRPAKRRRQEPESIFRNVKISVEGLDQAERSRYSDIIQGQDGIAVENHKVASNADYVLVDPSVAERDLKELKKRYQKKSVFVKKDWIDKCFDNGRIADTKGLTL